MRTDRRGIPSWTLIRGLSLCLALVLSLTVTAQITSAEETTAGSEEADPVNEGPTRGPITNLQLPRFVSLKSDKANVRRGPSLSHRIDWVFVERGYPLEVIAEYGHWRRVRDVEGATGWLHYSLISGVRTALVTEDSIDLFSRPDPQSHLTAQAEKNVILRLLECDISWCKVSVDGYKGWVLKSGLWGVRPDEILE